jgi:hypothetical protein
MKAYPPANKANALIHVRKHNVVLDCSNARDDELSIMKANGIDNSLVAKVVKPQLNEPHMG